ncbi:Protein of unknown function [Pyronema omphalodes CBS 100304]|uniref:Uncharacterized protein n=1 Tax=Pyronema omphalodes (strain CBS 100304) TaxID=1076935 RepID=U4L412_PYROM|nr:Protein of unknown function [Pyronema omphalodes CBS 100304]
MTAIQTASNQTISSVIAEATLSAVTAAVNASTNTTKHRDWIECSSLELDSDIVGPALFSRSLKAVSPAHV